MNTPKSHSIQELIAAGAHIFIEASAGSGKTTRLVELIVQLVAAQSVRIHEILCVTFTEKAASELKARVFEKLAATDSTHCREAIKNFSHNAIGTIHNFCLRSLRDDPGNDLAEDMETALLSEADLFEEAREKIYRTAWSEIPPGTLSTYLSALEFSKGGSEREFDRMLKAKATYAFASLQPRWGKIVSNAADVASPEDLVYFTLQSIVAEMRRIAQQRNAMTFSRMVSAMAAAVENRNFAAKVRSHYRYALIDEFQDTDEAQWQIFRTLFLTDGNAQRLIVVGDPKQAIYKFRGADVFVYLEARRELGKAGAIMDYLPVNYRSAPEILSVLDSVFTGELSRQAWGRADIHYSPPQYGGKTLSTQDERTGVEFYTVNKYSKDSERMFASLAAAKIAAIRESQPQWTVAVVAYKHKTLVQFAEILAEMRIDYSYYKQKPDFDRLETGHFKVLLESFALPVTEGYAVARTTLFARAQADSQTWYYALARHLAENRIVAFLQAIAQDASVLHLVLGADGSAGIFHSWRLFFQLLLSLCGKKIFDLDTLRRAVHDLASGDGETDDRSFGDILRTEGAVTLITVQSAKGLDWNVVVVADGINDAQWKNYPFFHDANGQGIIIANEDAFDAGNDKLFSTEEESGTMQLNLLYVALTRAKHKLIAYISPPFRKESPGPAAVFLRDWLTTAASKDSAAVVRDLAAAHSALIPRLIQPVKKVVEEKIDHGNIPERLSERTSFTALSHAEFTETDFIEDVLPRGSETGELLHAYLETCDFELLKNIAGPSAARLRDGIRESVQATYPHKETDAQAITTRIAGIFEATATAALPLSGGAGQITLAEIKPGNLWREMPFWGSSRVHKVLAGDGGANPVRRTMHGFMDLVFTPDERDYYILDYKSNSLAELDPAVIDAYTHEHYALQAQIYAEALGAYLTVNYGKDKRVAGCYFLFLRYLKSGAATGIHFMDFGGRK